MYKQTLQEIVTNLLENRLSLEEAIKQAQSVIPPADVAAAARRALEIRKQKPESQQGMTAVGLARANQLAGRKPVSRSTLKRMKSYFERHNVDKEGSTWKDYGKGHQAWDGWGGDAGRAWVNKVLKSSP